jgi:hypothetical protein
MYSDTSPFSIPWILGTLPTWSQVWPRLSWRLPLSPLGSPVLKPDLNPGVKGSKLFLFGTDTPDE